MSINIDVRYQYAHGNPILFWVNRFDPFIVGTEVPAHSGRVAMLKTRTSGSAGKPMIVNFRLARYSHIAAWVGMVDHNPFNTTSLVSYFSTGHTVIFRLQDPIVFQNEIITDYDVDQTIFSSGSGAYRKGFDLFRGTLNLIIVT